LLQKIKIIVCKY